MHKVWALIRRVWLLLAAASTVVGILYLWDDIQGLPGAIGQPNVYKNTLEWLVSFERETVAFLFLGLTFLWIFWMDVRPLFWRWLEKRRTFPIVIQSEPYCESYLLKSEPDQASTPFYVNVFYLCVGNGSHTGETLKRVQVRAHLMPPATICRLKDSESAEVDIRHGEWAYFEIGRFVSKDRIGLMYGIKSEGHNMVEAYMKNRPRGVVIFEVPSLIEENSFRIATTPDAPTIWPLFVVVSADNQKSRELHLRIDPSNADAAIVIESATNR